MAYSDVELLARLIQCEAGGEGDNGMRAVASVIMNRVRTPIGEYSRTGKGSIRNIAYQRGQFDCVREGEGQNIYNMEPTQVHYDIAQWALAGNRLAGLGDALWFFNPYSDTCPQYFPTRVGRFVVRIGDHCFYDPTDDYANT
ncbi:MAG: cell wall hydrolase [Oscillospiraceae bacterium]|nr:cell wall hydrolase [Oscillospiraceae bacterium]